MVKLSQPIYSSILYYNRIKKYESLSSEIIPEMNELGDKMKVYISPFRSSNQECDKIMLKNILELIGKLELTSLKNTVTFSDNLNNKMRAFLDNASAMVYRYKSTKECTEPGDNFDPYSTTERNEKRRLYDFVKNELPKEISNIEALFKKDIIRFRIKCILVSVILVSVISIITWNK